MYYSVFLVLDDLEQEGAVLSAWDQCGVTGITILDSTGLGRVRKRASLRDDMPLMPSLRDLLHAGEEHHRTFISVVNGEEMVERIIDATQAVLGDLALPNTGVLFAMPVTRVVGVPRRGNNDSNN
jgi:hypothetical protein